jgi:hypothetical protein
MKENKPVLSMKANVSLTNVMVSLTNVMVSLTNVMVSLTNHTTLRQAQCGKQ